MRLNRFNFSFFNIIISYMMFSGSGIVPIFIKQNKIYIITFIDRNNMASDAGGKIEENDKSNLNNVKKTAIRELFEESSGLIKIKNLDESVYYDLVNKGTIYRIFFIIINKINPKYFDKNLKKFNEYELNPFNEMYSIKLLDMSTIKFDKKDILINTIDDKIIKISPRLKFILYKIMRKFKTFENFYNNLETNLKINKINLYKKTIQIKSKEYDTDKKFIINNIISYQSN